jgi:hypothetical protein
VVVVVVVVVAVVVDGASEEYQRLSGEELPEKEYRMHAVRMVPESVWMKVSEQMNHVVVVVVVVVVVAAAAAAAAAVYVVYVRIVGRPHKISLKGVPEERFRRCRRRRFPEGDFRK